MIGYGKAKIRGIRGTLPLKLTCGKRSATLNVFAMPKHCKPLLGKNAIQATKVSSDAVPQVTKRRTVPLTNRKAVREETLSMIELGILKPCEKSDWQHGMVTIPKANGSVRTTTVLTPLNKFVIPGRHPLRNVKDMFLQLKGAKVFSRSQSSTSAKRAKRSRLRQKADT